MFWLLKDFVSHLHGPHPRVLLLPMSLSPKGQLLCDLTAIQAW